MSMREDLKAFVDNEVSETERVRILKELENNPELQAEVIELRQMSRMIHQGGWQPEPVGLEKTLRALEAGKKKSPWWLGPAFNWALGAACTVVLAAVLFPVFAQSKSAAKGSFASSEMAAQAPMPASSAPMEDKFGGRFDNGVAKQADGKVAKLKSQANVPRYQSGAGWPSNELAELPEQDLSVDQKGRETRSLSAQAQLRYQIKTASLSVEVEDVPKAQQEAENIAKAVNGRVESSQKSNDEGQLASAELTLRVPVAAFETAVNRIRSLGRVLNDGLSGQDVTTQVVDTEARLKVLRAEEDQYVELLKATKKIGEVLSVKERLSQVRQEIESLDAQRKALKDQAAESTIHLSLTERPKPDRPKQNENWSEDAWSRAVAGLNAVGRALGSAAVFLFVFSPIWMPVVLVIWWLARRARR